MTGFLSPSPECGSPFPGFGGVLPTRLHVESMRRTSMAVHGIPVSLNCSLVRFRFSSSTVKCRFARTFHARPVVPRHHRRSSVYHCVRIKTGQTIETFWPDITHHGVPAVCLRSTGRVLAFDGTSGSRRTNRKNSQKSRGFRRVSVYISFMAVRAFGHAANDAYLRVITAVRTW